MCQPTIHPIADFYILGSTAWGFLWRILNPIDKSRDAFGVRGAQSHFFKSPRFGERPRADARRKGMRELGFRGQFQVNLHEQVLV